MRNFLNYEHVWDSPSSAPYFKIPLKCQTSEIQSSRKNILIFCYSAEGKQLQLHVQLCFHLWNKHGNAGKVKICFIWLVRDRSVSGRGWRMEIDARLKGQSLYEPRKRTGPASASQSRRSAPTRGPESHQPARELDAEKPAPCGWKAHHVSWVKSSGQKVGEMAGCHKSEKNTIHVQNVRWNHHTDSLK